MGAVKNLTGGELNATKKKLRAAYNRGYLAGKKSPAHIERGQNAMIPSEKKQAQKVEVVLNYGELSISIRTDK